MFFNLNLIEYKPDKLKRNLKRANWNLFQQTLSNLSNDLETNSVDNIDKSIEIIQANIIKVLDLVAPETKQRNKPWWNFNENIQKLIKLRRSIRRQQKAARNTQIKQLWNKYYNRINKQCTELILQQKKQQ